MNIFFEVTTNLQASQHTDQGVIMGKERTINEGSDSREKILGSNKEGYLMAHKSKKSNTEGICDSIFNSDEIRNHIKAIKGNWMN